MRGRPSANRPGPAESRAAERGYNLLVLMVLVTVMNVALAVALPSWSQFVQREKEAEAIFRGLQYAEAIRVFQKRHSRLPTTLDELVEIEPRALRRLYPNPLHESGKWGILLQAAAGAPGGTPGGGAGGVRQQITPPGQRFNDPDQGGAGVNPTLVGGAAGQPGRYVAVPPAEEGAEDDESSLRGPRARTAGPIVGVYPATDATSLRLFFGQDNYSAWHFTVALIPLPVIVGDRGLPRVTSEWIGKPFREDLVTPAEGNAPGGGDGERRSRRGGGDKSGDQDNENEETSAGDDGGDE